MESPTSINLLPLSLSKKSVALNLQIKYEGGKQKYTLQINQITNELD